MVSAGKVSGDKSDLQSGLKSAKTALNSIGTSWQGNSHDTLINQFDNFYGQVNIVLNDMDSFKEAVDLYKEYKDAKDKWEHYKGLFNNCADDNPNKSSYRKKKNDAKEDMETLKKQINSALNSITGVKDTGAKKSSQLNIFEQGGSFGNKVIADIAAKEVGTLEYGGHEKYADFCNLAHSEPWCAAFVSWCCNEAGYGNSINPFVLVCKDEIARQKERGCDVHYGAKAAAHGEKTDSDYIPKPGDLIVFDFDDVDLDHVGIVESADKNSIHTIEGNTSGEENMSGKHDCVSYKTRSYSDAYAFVTPKK